MIATFDKPFADWMALWSPLYPAKYQDTAAHFNSGYLSKIPVTAGPFKIEKIDKTAKTVSMVPDPNWWGAKPHRRPHHHPRARGRRRASTRSSTARSTST